MKSPKNRIEYLLYNFFKFFILLSPRPVSIAIGNMIAHLIYLIDKKHRNIALKNLDIAFGSKLSLKEKKRIARKSFSYVGKTMFDIIKLSRMSQKKLKSIISVEGEEHLLEALKKERGILLFSAHFGNWEIAPVILSQWENLNVIARKLDNPFLEKELGAIREHFGAKVIYKHLAAKPVFRALKKKEMVAILMDQNVLRNQSVFVDFFNKKAATTPGPALFSLRANAPLLPAFCFPTSKLGYKLVISSPIEIPLTGDSIKDIHNMTQTCVSFMEKQIRMNPEYWLWLHNRWKTRPIDENH